MGNGILLCGCNGCGKTPLGRMLAQRLGVRFLDIEDYFFPKEDPDYPYRDPRSREEVLALLAADTAGKEPFLLAAVKGDFGRSVEERFACAVLLSAPETVRARRVRERSFGRFGERMRPGGDLYEAEERFFRAAAALSPEEVDRWANTLSCPVIRVDSDRPAGEILEEVIQRLPWRDRQ